MMTGYPTSSPLASDKLDILFHKSPQPMMIFDSSSLSLLDVNDAAVKIYGYSREEFLKMSIKDLRPEENMSDILSVNFTANEVFTIQSRHFYADKSLVDVEVTSFPFLFKGRKGRLAYIRDITAKKKQEYLLRFLNRAGIELGLSLSTGSALEKISQLIVPAFANWFTINILKGDDVEMILIKNEDPEYVEWAMEHRKKNPVTRNDDSMQGHLLRTGESSLVPVITKEMIETSIKDPELIEKVKALDLRSSITVPMIVRNQVTGNINFISSVKGRQYDQIDLDFAKDLAIRIGLSLENARLHEESQNEIRQRIAAEKTKDEFIGVASHELKTPLTTLIASLQLVDRHFHSDPASDAIPKLLERTNKSVGKLNELINQLLDISKIEGGKLKLNTSWFNITDLTVECAEGANPLGSHKISIEANEKLVVFGDPSRIEQVITNFVNNAIKYSPESSEIKISVESTHDRLKVSVVDQGIGISEDKLPFIFDRYYRVDHRRQFSGLGLGLYISSEIISLHDGKFGVTSEEGKGSTFWFTIPKSVSEVDLP